MRFETKKISTKWKTVNKRKVWPEKAMHGEDFAIYRVFDFLSSRGLIGYVLENGSYVDDMIKEFYCNLPVHCDNSFSPKYHKVFVRGKIYDFSPALIRQAWGLNESEQYINDEGVNMGLVMDTVTGGKIKKWSAKMKLVKLTSLCGVLQKIATTNWVPSTNPSYLTSETGIFLFKLMKGVPVDLASRVFESICAYS